MDIYGGMILIVMICSSEENLIVEGRTSFKAVSNQFLTKYHS